MAFKKFMWKKGQGAMEKIIGIVLLLVVLSLVLLFIFRANINAYLRQLPIFQAESKDSEVIGQDAVTTSKICERQIGYVLDDTTALSYERARIYIDGKRTSYLYCKSRKQIVNGNWCLLSTTVASVDSDSNIILSSGDFELQVLNGAYFSVNNKICMSK